MHTKNKRYRAFHLIVGKVKVGKVERKQVRKNDETLCANPIKKREIFQNGCGKD